MALNNTRTVMRAVQKEASKAHHVLEATFRLVCGQFSSGRTPKKQKNIKIAGDRARNKTEENTVFGR